LISSSQAFKPALKWLFVAVVINLLLFSSSNSNTVIAGATALFALFTTLPYIAVWVMRHTSGDLLLYCIFALGLGVMAIIEKIRLLLDRSTGSYQRT
jgi:hypothetical protein